MNNLIYFTNCSAIHDRFFIDQNKIDVYNKHRSYFSNEFYCHELAKSNKINRDHYNDYSFIKKSFVFLITETVGEYPYPYLSEKTWRVLLYKMPFMIIGGKHSLKLLKSFGFKTFNEYWNEDYDNLENLIDRVDMVTDNLQKLSMLSQNELDNLYEKMLPIVEYNFAHLDCFYKEQTTNIKEKIQNL